MIAHHNGRTHHHRRIFGRDLTSDSYRRFGIGLITAVALFVVLFARLLPTKVDLTLGARAPRAVIAQRTAYYVDTQETQRLRDQAAQAEEDVYVRDMNARRETLSTIKDIFDRAVAVRGDASHPRAIDKVDALRDQLDIQLGGDVLNFLIEAPTGTLDRVRDTASALCDQQMQKQIRNNGEDLDRARDDVMRDANRSSLTAKYAEIAGEIARAALKPNSTYDATATQAKREAAAQRIEEVRQQVRAGDIVVRADEVVTQRHIDIATALGLLQPQLDYWQAAGMFVTLWAIVMTLGLFLYRFQERSYVNMTHLWLIGAVLVLAALGYRFAQQTSWFEALALCATTASCIFIALLLSPATAVASAAALSLNLGLVAVGSDTRLVIASMLCGVMAAQAVSGHGNRRGVIARTAAIMMVCNAAVLAAVNGVFGNAIVGRMEAGAGVGGLLAVLFAVGAALVLERPLGIVTDFRLMELGNPSEPILKRLLTEAPASYQASVMVGNIAEPAADAIGANGLLCRVAAMYHDIGKLKRPFFFVENLMRGADNPHERLSPYLSALILIAHVKDGVELAREHQLPEEVASIIAEHHGTSLIAYFYDKAIRQAGPDQEVSAASFRYPGPKPHSKENAIIMLADIVEAASRTLQDFSPIRIQEMIDVLVAGKVEDGQLDDCPLTFHDLTVVKRSFLDSLTAAFHQRIRYPDQIRAEAQKAVHEELRRSPSGATKLPGGPEGIANETSGQEPAGTSR
jgi:putative nucleotidyltransferase with HDIG domain